MSRQLFRAAVFGPRVSRRRRVSLVLIWTFLATLLTWSLASFARSVPTRVFLVPSNSMAPTIMAGDRVGVQTFSSTRPKRGEIWVFHSPNSTSQVASIFVKRVIGLPGETIEVAGNQVLIDGQAIHEPYLSTAMTYTLPVRKLGAEEYFMLGDSRDSSQDSHVWGPLPGDRLIGPVTVRVWPIKRIGEL